MTTLENKLTKNDYLADDKTVAELARQYTEGNGTVTMVNGSYLRILTAHAKSNLAQAVGVRRAARATSEAMNEAVEKAHEHLYGIVMAAVLTPDLTVDASQPWDVRRKAAMERNRRTNFARTAKHALSTFVAHGGKLYTLKPAEVTKAALGKRDEPVSLAEKADSMAHRLERLLKRLVKQDQKETAQEIVDRVLEFSGELLADKPARRTRARVVSMTPDQTAPAAH